MELDHLFIINWKDYQGYKCNYFQNILLLRVKEQKLWFFFYLNAFFEKKFLENNIGEFSIIEHFGVFFRFKLNVHTPVATIFGIFEENVLIFYF